MLHMVMKTMSVLEIDEHWQEACEALKADSGILVTRDGEMIGKLVPLEKLEELPRKRFDPEELRKWRKETFGDSVTFDTLSSLMEDREAR